MTPPLVRRGGRTVRPVAPDASARPSVSVLVLCWNYGRFLEACTWSLLDQAGVDVDVLIIDDASTDDSADVADRLAAADPRVRVVHHGENRGQLASINEGMGKLGGEYVMKFDADDLLSPGSLRRSTTLLDNEPGVGFVYGRPVHFSGRPPRRHRDRVTSWTLWSGREWLGAVCDKGANVISQPEVVMRRNALVSVGEHDESLGHTFDMEMWMRLATRWDVGRVNGCDQAFYRVHPDSLQRTLNAGILTDLRGRLAAFDAALERGVDRVPDAAELRALAHRRIAETAVDEVCRAHDRGRTDDTPVGELLDLARDADASVVEGAHGVARSEQQRRADRDGPWHPRTVARVLRRRATEELAAARWRRTGI